MIRRKSFTAVCVAGLALAMLMTAPASSAFGAAGDPEPGFDGPGFDAPVTAVVIQPDGKTLVGGFFTEADGEPVSRIVRLEADGSLDPSFSAPLFNLPVHALALQPDGRILVGGDFTSVDGNTNRRYLVRLDSTGAVDPQFTPPLIDMPVLAVEPVPGGKVMIGGAFTAVGANQAAGVARLLADGSFDNTFNPAAIDGEVHALAVRSDGRVLIAGDFDIAGADNGNLALLDATGTRNNSLVSQVDGPVLALAPLPGGVYVIGGLFQSAGNGTAAYLATVNQSGNPVAPISFATVNGPVRALATDPAGAIVAGGSFTSISGLPVSHLARFVPGGVLDTGFNSPVVSGAVIFTGSRIDTVAINPDTESVTVGGRFTSPGGYLARLSGPQAATQPTINPPGGPLFGQVPEGSQATATVTVTAAAGSPLQVASASISGPHSAWFAIADDGCTGEVVAPAATCDISLRFTSVAVGNYTATLTLDANTDDPVFVPLTATGVSKTRLDVTAKLSPAKVKPGKAGTFTVKVGNSGGAAASAVSVCPKLSGAAKKALKIQGGSKGCKKIAQLSGNAKKSVKLKLKSVRKKAKAGKNYKVGIEVKAKSAFDGKPLKKRKVNASFRIAKGSGAASGSRPAGEETAADGPSADPGPNWKLVFADEFDGDQINPANWAHQTDCWGGGNNELQCYTDSPTNSFVENGKLHIKAIEEQSTGCNTSSGTCGPDGLVTRNFTSARLRSLNKHDFKYGRIEFRAKLPGGKGIWPAFWMMPTDSVYGGWARSGEIDVMEAVNLDTSGGQPGCPGGATPCNRLHGTLHFGNNYPNNAQNTGSVDPARDMTETFNLFAIEWQERQIRWFINGHNYRTLRQEQATCTSTGPNCAWYTAATNNSAAPFNQRFHLIMNLAVGGNWPGPPNDQTTYPQQIEVDYVRVYQCSSGAETGEGCSG